MKAKPAKLKRAVIPANCRTIGRVYDIFARGLALPRHFGRNLDALHDSLTGDVAGPFEIVVRDGKALEAALGAKGKALVKLLRDVAKARTDAKITIGGRRARRTPARRSTAKG